MKGKQMESFSDILKEVKSLALVQRARITEVVQISAKLQNSPLHLLSKAHSQCRAESEPRKMTQQIIPLRTQISIAAIVALAT